MSARGREILVVEHEPREQSRLRDAFAAFSPRHAVHMAVDGVEAMCFLQKRDRFSTSPRPDIILLNPLVPNFGGPELVREIKHHNLLRRIPLLALSASKDPAHIDALYDVHANAYIYRPSDDTRLFEVIRHVGEYWLALTELSG